MGKLLLIMLAGPNGAGKTTFHESHLKPLGLPFLNADNLVRKTGLDACTAADTIAAIRDGFIQRRESFVAETEFSDPVGEKVLVLEGAGKLRFDVTLIYIGVASVDLSRRRVRARVKAGGHDVPVEKLTGRYKRSLENLGRAIRAGLRVMIYDNSSFGEPHQLVAEIREGKIEWRAKEMPGWMKEC